MLIAFVLLVREPDNGQGETVKPGAHPPFWAGLWRDLKVLSVQPLFWQVTLISGLTFGLMLGVGIIWGIKLLIFKGFDPTSASNINATIWFGFGTGALLVHVFSDYVRSFKLTCIIFLTMRFNRVAAVYSDQRHFHGGCLYRCSCPSASLPASVPCVIR